MRTVLWISVFSLLWLTGFPELCPAEVLSPDSSAETFAVGSSHGTIQVAITTIPPEPSESEERMDMIADPLEPLNRVFFRFNDKFYFWILKPAAVGYKTVIPEEARVGVRNFFSNLTTPIRLVNCLLQVNFEGAGTETIRLLVNSTLGLAGFLDPAQKELHLEKKDEDFGQTLGFWGIGPAFYIDWPILGPKSLIDTVGYVGDLFLDPVTYIPSLPINFSVKAYDAVNETSLTIREYEDFKESAVDPYIALKDAYHQYRQNKIRKR